jgi:triacylglycerol lipase
VSADLLARYSAARAGKAVLSSRASELVYLAIPGYLARHLSLPFEQNLRALRSQGLDARLSAKDTDASVSTNAQSLAREIRALHLETGKAVVAIVHSSGAPELHEALVLDPDLRTHLHCVLSLNGTFLGTPVAALFAALPSFCQRALSAFARWLGIDTQGILDVTVKHRRAFQERHPYPADVVTLAVATSWTRGFSVLSPLMWGLRRWSPRGLSDGLIPTDHQHLPGHRVAFLSDADHSDAVMPRPGSRQSPGALTLAGVSLVLDLALPVASTTDSPVAA